MPTKTAKKPVSPPCVDGTQAHRRPIVQVEGGYVGKCIHCGDEQTYTGIAPTVEHQAFNRGPRSGK